MRPLTCERLAASAYRTLGLTGSSSQAAIENAARRMRIWADPTQIATTPWDLPWLGPLSRSRTDIEQAVARLTEPVTRLEERLIWYCSARPPGDGAAEATSSALHDAVVGSLHTAYLNDPNVSDVERWRGVVQRLDDFATSPESARWMAEIEAGGDFEKRPSTSEIHGVIEELPGALAAALVTRAEAALDCDDLDAAGGVISLLGDSATDGRSAEAVEHLMDRLEDTININCGEMDRELRDKLRTNHAAPVGFYLVNERAARTGAEFYNTSVGPPFERLVALATNDPERLMRVRSRCATELGLLALGWEWAGKYMIAVETLHLALDMAEGTRAVHSLRNDLKRCEPLAEQERLGYFRRAVLLKTLRRPANQKGWGGWGWVVGAVIAAARLGSSVFGPSHQDHSGPGNHPRYDSSQMLRDIKPYIPTTSPGAASQLRDESIGETSREP